MSSQSGASSSNSHLMDVPFRLPSGGVKTLKIDLNQTVKSLKVFLSKALNEIPNDVKDINLSNGDEPMSNKKHVKTYANNGDKTINISIKGSGGGKNVVKKTATKQVDDIAKRTILQDKREKIMEADTKDYKSFNDVMTVVDDAKAKLTKLYTDSELDSINAFKGLLRSLPDEVIGSDDENSGVLEVFNNNKVDSRLVMLGELVMKHNYQKLFELYQEVGGLMETTELTFEFVLSQAFLKPQGTWDWALMKKIIKDEITIRNAVREMSQMKM